MPGLLISLLLLLVTVIIFSYKSRQAKSQQLILPNQKRMVLDLIRELKTSRIDIIFADKSGEKHSVTLNLFEARFFLESSKELANERYDNLPLFFSDHSSQVLNLKKFIGDSTFPPEIMEELNGFFNTSFECVKPDHPYFIVITDIETDNSDWEESPREGLFKGNAEAFGSWLAFKECADNLNYVIGQWIKEHEKITDSELYAEFL